jgi:hypothetical protein
VRFGFREGLLSYLNYISEMFPEIGEKVSEPGDEVQ